MDINIRNIEYKDFRKVEEVSREAFWNLYFPGCNEHFVIHNIKDHKDFIPKLSFVIELDGEIIGSIIYTHSKVISKNNKEYNTISFGPVFIDPRFHRLGLGRKLISHSIEEARKQGFKAILTLGYPYHYETYGFLGGKNYSISMADGKFYKGLLVLPLYEGALDTISGHVVFSDALEATEEEVLEFDEAFPKKEKGFQESQLEFEIYSSMIDE